MSGQITEVAFLPLQPNLDLTSGDVKAVWDDTLQTIASQPGCQSLFWGRQIEKPDVVQLVIEWESYQNHQDFMANPVYEPFLKRLDPLLASPPHLLHLKIPNQNTTTLLSTPLSASVTECISLYFDPSLPESEYDKNWASFLEEASKVPSEAQGVVGGWSMEEQKHEKLGSKDGEEGAAKFFGGFIGWPSVEAHMKFREHDEFPKVIAPLRNGPKALSMCHVAFQKYH